MSIARKEFAADRVKDLMSENSLRIKDLAYACNVSMQTVSNWKKAGAHGVPAVLLLLLEQNPHHILELLGES